MGIKKGQITIFITLGIVLFIIFVIVFLVRADLIGKLIREQRIDPNLKDINARVTSCMETIGNSGLELIGLQGGKVTLRPDTYLSIENLQISYLGMHSTNLVPQINQIENELSLFMKDNLIKCAEEFKFQPYEVKYSNIIPKTEIKDDKVIFEVNWPIVLTKNEKNYKLSSFRYETPEKNTENKKMIRLGHIVNIAREIVDNLCVTRDKVKEFDVNIDYTNYEDDILYIIEDNDYHFAFAINKCLQ